MTVQFIKRPCGASLCRAWREPGAPKSRGFSNFRALCLKQVGAAAGYRGGGFYTYWDRKNIEIRQEFGAREEAMFNRGKRAQKVQQEFDRRISELGDALSEKAVSPSLKDNMVLTKRLFDGMDLIKYKSLTVKGASLDCFLMFCDGMVDNEMINQSIVRPLMVRKVEGDGPVLDALAAQVLQVAAMRRETRYSEIVREVMSGNTVLFVDTCAEAIVLSTKDYVVRAVDEPENEKSLVGPREGFTESLLHNLSQIIRRVHTNELKVKMLTIGRRTKTSVCVAYFDSLVDKKLLGRLLDQLNAIDIDGILDVNYITELIRDNKYTVFRTTGYTERPDTVIGKLLEGRMAIFVDGTPMVLTVPYFFIENFQSSEDYYFNFFYSSFARLIRILAFFLTVTVPAFYISIVAFHQEMLPLNLLIRIAQEQQAVPLPAALEAVIMLLIFDVLRETGVRMPSNIAQTLSIVGVLVIGESAVQANLVSAPMIIIVAATGITNLLVPKLNAPVIFWRFTLLAFASAFGFFGFAIGFSLMIMQINNLSSLGVEQTVLSGQFRVPANEDILVRLPWFLLNKRPPMITSNFTRQGGGSDG